MSTYHARSLIEKVERDYDPEFDRLRGGPEVPWPSARNAEAIKALCDAIEKLEARVAQLEADLAEASA
jgi:hypothetical protein